MILHLILNSLIVFICLALIIEFFLFSMRIKNSRIRYICRSLPFLKIPFDISIFLFYGDSLFINLNPLSCEIYVFDLISKLLPTQITQISSTNEHLIIPQYIAMLIPSFWLDGLTIMVILIAAGGIIRKLCQLFASRKYLEKVLSSSIPFDGVIINKQLQQHIENSKAIILVSPDIEIPCAADTRYILLPQNKLSELSREELEAVIAHELQHLKWKDPLLNLLYSLVCSLCWWIPTGWWLKRLIAEQEQASDAGIHNYGIDNFALATAVTKILYKAKNIKFNTSAMCFLGSSKSTHVNRIKYILNAHAVSASNRYVLSSVLATILCSISFVSLWMC